MAVLARAASGEISAGPLVFIRFMIGLVFVVAYYAATRTRPILANPWRWAQRGVLGGAAVYLYFFAIERLQVGPASLLNNTFPIWASLFAVWFLKEPLRGAQIIGLFASIAGAALVIWGTVPAGGSFELGGGAWAGLLSAVFSGGAVATMRVLRKDTDAVTVFFSFCLFGALISLPLAIAEWKPMSFEIWMSALWVGLAALVAQLLYTYALGFTSTAAGSATALLTPAFAWMMGVAFLGESAPIISVAGAVLCVAGVLWPVVTNRNQPLGPPQE